MGCSYDIRHIQHIGWASQCKPLKVTFRIYILIFLCVIYLPINEEAMHVPFWWLNELAAWQPACCDICLHHFTCHLIIHIWETFANIFHWNMQIYFERIHSEVLPHNSAFLPWLHLKYQGLVSNGLTELKWNHLHFIIKSLLFSQGPKCLKWEYQNAHCPDSI